MRSGKELLHISIYFAMILLLGVVDWLSGSELTFSIFYLIPLVLLASIKGIHKSTVGIASIVAGITCYVADSISGPDYSTVFIPLWNGFVRLAIFLIIALAVSSLRKQQELLKEKNEKLELLNEEKNRFLGVTAHDLMTPLGAIHSFSEFLLNDGEIKKVSKSKLDILDIINKTSKNSLNLVRNLLDISKIDSGTIHLNIQVHDYVEFLKHTITLNQILADRKGIKIILEAGNKSIMAEFDDEYMREAIDNLLSNAVKYSHSGSNVLVKVSGNHSVIMTEVVDSGVGIAEHEIQKLFKPFSRSSARATSGEKATGLGLATVKKVVEEHKGEVGVKSKVGNGSTFYFTFPAQHSADNKRDKC